MEREQGPLFINTDVVTYGKEFSLERQSTCSQSYLLQWDLGLSFGETESKLPN